MIMAFLNSLVSRILGPASFPRFRTPLVAIEPQVYQPPPTIKVTVVPNPPQPTIP